MPTQQTTYDYIIAGSGCAGLSLLYNILQIPALQHKKILVVDKTEKKENDRTWCFWESDDGLFEPIVHHRWDTLSFLTTEYKRTFDMGRYSYKMIQAADFYRFVKEKAAEFKNVDFLYSNISAMYERKGNAILETDTGSFSAHYIFNSTGLFHPVMNEENSLLQHFEGWVIQTKENAFDSAVGTLMDFRIPQQNGATFMYVLPTAENKALVEYTLFSKTLLDRAAYSTALEDYISNVLQLRDYTNLHKEFGIIPMSLAAFQRSEANSNAIIHLGTAGGFTKASSGYTFQFIQKHTAKVAARLEQGKSPLVEPGIRDRIYAWYDRTLLDVLLEEKLSGKEVFSKIFRKLPPETIFRFLGNESTLTDDLRIMRSLPVLPFLTSGIRQLNG